MATLTNIDGNFKIETCLFQVFFPEILTISEVKTPRLGNFY